jgi:hypothetical protein
LYRDPAKGEQLDEGAIGFLRVITRQLEGLFLLLNLHDVFEKSGDVQVPVLRNILLIVRWLQGGGVYEEGARSFQNQIDSGVHRMPRLRIPVQLLLSKADEMARLAIPKQGRLLFPAGEDPLAVVHHCAPKLLSALRAHARHFRIDFVHSLRLDRASGAVVSREGCGIELSAEWLLEASRPRRWPAIPTRWWLSLDEHVFRSARWKRLPPTQKVG